jgi:pimeloyl-ACP methyl ester carboxylesterase
VVANSTTPEQPYGCLGYSFYELRRLRTEPYRFIRKLSFFGGMEYTQKSTPSDGPPVCYYAQGSSRKGVIFLHGDGQNYTAGLDILGLFPDDYTKLGIDRPGHGRSPMLHGRTIEKECDILDDILSKEDIKEPILIGHSSGTVIAASYASRRRAKALVLINPFFMNPRKLFFGLLSPVVSFFEKKYLDEARGKHNPDLPYHMFGNEHSEEEIHRKAFAHTPYETLRQNLGLFEGYDVREEIRHADFPVLVIYSTKGLPLMNGHVKSVCKGIPNARIEVVDGTHNIHILAKKETEKKIKENMQFLGI